MKVHHIKTIVSTYEVPAKSRKSAEHRLKQHLEGKADATAKLQEVSKGVSIQAVI